MVINMRIIKNTGIALLAGAAIYLTACGSSLPDMTEEQNEQIVEYAAGLLLKYDENPHSRLVDLQEETENVKEDIPEETENEKVEEKVPEETQETETPETVDRTEASAPVKENQKIEDFYGLNGVEIRYTGYELKDGYPDLAPGEVGAAMKATAGCKLLLLNFDVVNISGQNANIDMQTAGAKFKISINGEPPRYALTTMLLDDLSSFEGTVPANETVHLVLVGELTEEKAAGIQSISLSMKNAAENAAMTLN